MHNYGQDSRQYSSSLFWFVIGAVILLAFTASPLSAQQIIDKPQEFENAGVDEHLGDTIPMNLTFTNEQGEPVELSQYFHQDKPVIVTLVYYSCPMLCNLILNGLSDGLSRLDWTPGKEYQIVTISFNPRETPKLAAAKKENYLKSLGKPGGEKGWAFLTGTEDQSKALADAIGFRYYWDEENQQYAHPSAIFVMTPEGAISRYLYGIEYKTNDLKLSMLEASRGNIGSTVDKIILYCFHYDPDSRGYVVFAGNVMKLGGALTLGVLLLFLGIFWRREKSRKNRQSEKSA